MEPTDYIRFLAALIFVLALIGAGAFALRASGLTPVMGKPKRGSRRRLAVLETLHLDPKRRLALISRDGVEHLIVLGPSGETIVETGIEPKREPEFTPISEPDLRAELAAFPHLKAERLA